MDSSSATAEICYILDVSRSSGTVHTSAKVRLTSVVISVDPRCLSWAGYVIVAVAMPAIVHALHCSVAQRSRLIPLSLSPTSDESGKESLYPEGDPDRHQN